MFKLNREIQKSVLLTGNCTDWKRKFGFLNLEEEGVFSPK